ncbi:uncharacterized protein F5147DRAFT_699442 [Suillus discolor]|uniref:DUF6533 domain-containing protein n=1 Tax=Suillus discolor TaxID=1912936 RepID=A0A9P7JTA3_9AGAM|nr:uncharacterized protein F5147DRAFT_699442 [Suillus discolor]KAG2107061.1 hypothetical protein F5147DRAFT_699442 [Suillus discolor]
MWSLSGLVFTREVELIWCQRWRLTTVLYIIARYLGLAIAIIQILGGPGILLSDTVKRGIVGKSWSWGMVALACTMYAIMSIRVFAMYHRSMRMRIFLIICFLVASAFRGVTDGLASEECVLSESGVCTTCMASMVPFFEGIPSLCIELLFLLLTVRVLVEYVREMQRTRSDDRFGDGHGDIIAILRDHVLHFSCYLILSVMQVATISANGGTDGSRWYRSIATFFVTIQQCVLVPRLVISTREYFSQLDYVSDRVTDLDAMAFAYNPNVNI